MANPSSSLTPTFVSPSHLPEAHRTLNQLNSVKPHELTPGIPVEEFERRRKELMDSLPSNSVVVSVAAPIKFMSGSA
jgi:hypothetical protein